MKIKKAIALFLCALVASCSYIENQRLVSNTSKDLDIKFSSTPKVLQKEDYGWAEEGGDRAIMQLANTDCTNVAGKLNVVSFTPDLSDFERLLKMQSKTIGEVKFRSSMSEHGDLLIYALDIKSCVLYRMAHFE